MFLSCHSLRQENIQTQYVHAKRATDAEHSLREGRAEVLELVDLPPKLPGQALNGDVSRTSYI